MVIDNELPEKSAEITIMCKESMCASILPHIQNPITHIIASISGLRHCPLLEIMRTK